MTEYKQVILVRSDLKLPKGKLAAQAAHAAVDATLKQLNGARGSSVGRGRQSGSDIVFVWKNQGMKKVALKVVDEKELYTYVQQAKDAGLVTAIITDAGKTVVAPGTVTCAAIGPNSESAVNTIVGGLKLL
ncbi:MAG: peptidyl-tRNA hydrolase Pth2 [Candidatus Nanoarchaeia archaeon]